MPDTGLVHLILAHAGLYLTMMGSGSLVDTGTAIAAGATMIIIGTATATAIFVNMTVAETTAVTKCRAALDVCACHER
jgi:Na+-transporting methylmalonyl-CoA/oxaloacetate decarboxylase beta subunit